MELTKFETIPETTLETELKQDETKAETSPETQDTLTASKVNQVFHFKAQGRTYRDIASETGLSLATISRMLKDLPNKEENIQVSESESGRALFHPVGEQAISLPFVGHDSALVEAVQPVQPQNYFLKPGLTSQEWAELSKKDKASLLAMVGELRAQNSSLQASAVMGKGNGNGDSTAHHHNGDSSDSESAFWAELAKTERVERALRIRDRYNSTVSTEKKAETSTDIKQVLEIFKIFAPKQANELEIYKQASEDTRKNLETLMKKEASNEIDVKLEEIRQSERLDMKKLDWELEKWRLDKSEDGRKWEVFEKLAEGPIGQAIQSIGNAGAQRLRKGKQPKIMPITCPNCQQQIFVDGNSETEICGRCGSQLSRNQESPQTQTEPQQQPQTTEEPSEESLQAPEETVQPETTKKEVKKNPEEYDF